MKRHAADVTNERLRAHYEKWYDRFSASERDAIGIVRDALARISGEDLYPEESAHE